MGFFTALLRLPKHIPRLSCVSKSWTRSSAGSSSALARYGCLFFHYQLHNVVCPPPTPSHPHTSVHLSLLKTASAPYWDIPAPPLCRFTHPLLKQPQPDSPGCCLCTSFLKRAALLHQLLTSICLISYLNSPAHAELFFPPMGRSANCSAVPCTHGHHVAMISKMGNVSIPGTLLQLGSASQG